MSNATQAEAITAEKTNWWELLDQAYRAAEQLHERLIQGQRMPAAGSKPERNQLKMNHAGIVELVTIVGTTEETLERIKRSAVAARSSHSTMERLFGHMPPLLEVAILSDSEAQTFELPIVNDTPICRPLQFAWQALDLVYRRFDSWHFGMPERFAAASEAIATPAKRRSKRAKGIVDEYNLAVATNHPYPLAWQEAISRRIAFERGRCRKELMSGAGDHLPNVAPTLVDLFVNRLDRATRGDVNQSSTLKIHSDSLERSERDHGAPIDTIGIDEQWRYALSLLEGADNLLEIAKHLFDHGQKIRVSKADLLSNHDAFPGSEYQPGSVAKQIRRMREAWGTAPRRCLWSIEGDERKGWLLKKLSN